jgi:hypothetical protein
MVGAWAQKGFHMSYDGKTVLSHRFDGFRVIKEGGPPLDYDVPLINRNLFWGPDGKHFILWAPEGVAVADVDALGEPCGPAKYNVLYKPAATRHPFGACWSPSGHDIYVIENYEEEGKQGSAIERIPAGGGAPTEILHHPTRVMYFMPPLTRYEDGSGPNARAYRIIFGAKDGLWIMDRDGGNKIKLSDVRPDGIEDVIWSPGEKEKFTLLFRQPQKDAKTNKVLKGVYLVHLENNKIKDFEQLYDSLDVHTMWFSPHGKYISWGTNEGIFYREPDAKPETTVKVDIPGKGGLEIKGFSWDSTENRLAIAVGNRLFVHDATKKTTTQVAQLGDDVKSFAADPVWRGNEVVLVLFTDTSTPERKKK